MRQVNAHCQITDCADCTTCHAGKQHWRLAEYRVRRLLHCRTTHGCVFLRVWLLWTLEVPGMALWTFDTREFVSQTGIQIRFDNSLCTAIDVK